MNKNGLIFVKNKKRKL